MREREERKKKERKRERTFVELDEEEIQRLDIAFAFPCTSPPISTLLRCAILRYWCTVDDLEG